MAPDASTAEQILRGSGGMRSTRPPRPTDSLKKLVELHPAKVKRARKREVRSAGRCDWFVSGFKDEKHTNYQVMERAGEWECACYAEEYGDTRRRQVCSHVLAVWLHLKEGEEGAPAVHEGGTLDLTVGGKRVVAPVEEPELPPATTAKKKKLKKAKKKAEKKSKKKGKDVQVRRPTLHPTDSTINPEKWAPVPFEEYRPDQVDAALEVMDAFKSGVKVVMVDAPTGCLAADTLIKIQRNRATRTHTIKQVAERLHTSWSPGSRTQQAVDGYVKLGTIKDAFSSGRRLTYTLQTKGGREIRATLSHRFMTPSGWIGLGDLRVGGMVHVNVGRERGARAPKNNYHTVNNLRAHPHAGRRGVQPDKGGWSVAYHRLVAEALVNDVRVEDYIELIRRGETDGFIFLDPIEHQVHHLDEDHTNNVASNLQILSAAEHAKLHADDGAERRVLERVGVDTITSIEKYGEEEVFDIEMVDEPQFIANGFVVHNSGKTGIADLVSRLSYQPTVFMCSTKSLQDQVLDTFDYARVLKGRANYATMKAPFPEVTCDDCTATSVEENNCMWCEPVAKCPYRVAKSEAIRAQLAVLNTAYWIREANHAQGFAIPPMDNANFSRPGSRRQGHGGLFVVDECDLMKNALYGYVEFAITDRRARDLEVTPPKKGSHKQTIAKWLTEELRPAAWNAMKRESSIGSVESMRRARGYQQLIQDADSIVEDVTGDNWIRDNSNDRVPLSMKPVLIAPYTKDLVWGNVGRTVMMSATIISPDELAETLGIDHEYRVVTAPMRFPVKNRPIIAAPVVSMKGGEQAGKASGAWDEMVNAIANILDLPEHAGQRVLIHTVSYALAKHLMLRLRHETRRELVTYSNAGERDTALARFRGTEGGVLVASSLDRGIDLADDDCRVIIVAKIPFPNLGDPQVSALLHAPGGEETYAVETVRTLVQMTGRGVRHARDTCTTWILDAEFTRNLLRRRKNLLPGWWRDALDTGFNVSTITRKRGN